MAIKPQLARFELFGAGGREALGRVVRSAHDAGLLVIADAKRGDIDVTARAYAQSLFGGVDRLPGLGADLATVNPLMGPEAVEPFVEEARAAGGAVLVLVRTSNPGAGLIQDAKLEGGETVWEQPGPLRRQSGRRRRAGAEGLDDVGAVVGATAPAQLERARELMPRAVILLPGIGAQGGRVEDLAPAFRPGRAGGLVSASRAIVDAHREGSAGPERAARDAAEQLREQAWDLSSAALSVG